MMVGVLGMVLYKMIYSFNIANGYRFTSLLFLGISAIINVVSNLLFIPKGGIIAAAWCSVISYLLCGLCFAAFFCKKTNIHIYKLLVPQREDLVMLKGFLERNLLHKTKGE
ncbi:MAG: polysaccharide biosynthesis C-terminal domain-containing protein [Clostridia bacterium]|nr:polysaccharide biosynthesis C-terminal domain-containing protein [Clostridia bacterium]